VNDPAPSAAPLPGAAPASRPCPAVAWRTLVLLGLALGLVTLLTYSNSFEAGLTLDNKVVLAQDPRIREWNGQNLRLIFQENYWWPYAASDLYRPLTTLSYLINYAVLGNGARVAGYHWVNFLLHWANAWLVLVILHRLTARTGVALLAAALFAVHPANVESVTNLIGRADLLAAFSILAGGWCYLRAAGVSGLRKLPWLGGVALIACAGVLMKESAVMIGAFVLLYDWLWRWPELPGATWRERLPAAAREFGLKGWIALVPAVCLLLWARHRLLYVSPVYGQSFVDNPIAYAGVFPGFMTAMKVIGRYLSLLVLPGTLSCDYSYNQIPLFGEAAHWWEDLYAWAALAVVVALVWAAVRGRRVHVSFAWGTLFFLLLLLPTSNLLVPIGSIMAERFLYLPSLGFCLVAALALQPMGRALARLGVKNPRWQPWAAWALPALVVAVFALRTHVRNADWRDDLALWENAVAAAPDSFKTHKGYANALWDAGRNEPALDAALARAEEGLAVLDRKSLAEERRDNTLFYDLGMYYRLKGDFLSQRGQPGEAGRCYRKSVDLLLRAQAVDRWANEASHRASLRRDRPADELADVGNFRIYLQLGQSYLQLGNWAGAETAGRYAQRLMPNDAGGYMLVSAAVFATGHHDAAAIQTLAALVLQPANAEAWANLAKCYAALGLVPAPIGLQGPNHVLDDGNPIVRRQLVEACRALMRNFETARLPWLAQVLREQAVTQYHMSAADIGPPEKR
jgi:tetratricopeptide (TPR) repeat protein